MVPQLHAKYPKKTREPILKKVLSLMDKHINWAILGLFGLLLGKQGFCQKTWLCQF